jgi:uncharacterized protein YecE (DUF72 family)
MTAQPDRPLQVRIGCSGWQYARWRGNFYPVELPQRLWYEHYARLFNTAAPVARRRGAIRIYACFNNDGGGHAPRDAKRLRERMGRHASANL